MSAAGTSISRDIWYALEQVVPCIHMILVANGLNR